MMVMGRREEESKPLEERSSNRAVIMETAEMGTIPNGNSTALSAPKPSWFTPKRLLVIFSVINLLNYLDRGAIGSNGVNGSRGTCTNSGTCTPGTGIQGNFSLSNFQDGVLSSAFTVGLVVASPIFASLAKSVNPFRLIGVGLSVWTFATAGCGFSFNFWSITICRMLVGVGEASFISLAAPFIDDNAPAAQKTAWLGIFYMCIPAGVAFGYVYGGLVGDHFSWRYAFFGEAILMFPFALLGFVMTPLQMKGFPHAESKMASTAMETAVSEVKDDSTNKGSMSSIKEEFVDQGSEVPSKSKCGCINLDQFSRFFKDMKVLLLDKVYVVNVLGYISYNFVIGAYSYWGPKAGFSIYHMSNTDMIFGGITVGCGILGTLAGGYVLDKMTSTISNAFKASRRELLVNRRGKKMENSELPPKKKILIKKKLNYVLVNCSLCENQATKLSVVSTLLSVATLMGGGFCFAAFCFKSQYAFLVLFAIGELLVFATQAPVNYVCLHCVMPNMRPLSMAMSTVAIHVFGDVPSSPLVGVLQDNLKDWRKTTLILTSILFLAAGIWFIGIFLRSVDRFNEESEHPMTTAKKSNTENTERTTESAGEP